MESNFKDIKNYIHNELNLTKDDIKSILLEVVTDIVKEEMTKLSKDGDFIRSYIDKEILRQLRYGELAHERRSYLISTMDAIYNKIDSTIHEEVCKRLRVELVEPEVEDGK